MSWDDNRAAELPLGEPKSPNSPESTIVVLGIALFHIEASSLVFGSLRQCSFAIIVGLVEQGDPQNCNSLGQVFPKGIRRNNSHAVLYVVETST